MKVALYHNLTSGGSKREAYEFTRQFAQHGHTVHVFRPSTADERFLPSEKVAQRTRIYPLTFMPVVAGRLPLLRRYVDLGNLLLNLRRIEQLARRIAVEIDAGGYDWVFVHHDRIVQSPYLLQYLQTPSAYFCAEPMRAFYEPPISRPYLQPHTWVERWQTIWYAPADQLARQVIRALDWHNVRCATRLLTNSFFSAESIYRAYSLRAGVVYLGVDIDKFRPLRSTREDIVLAVGAVSPLKGYDFLIEALGYLPEAKRPTLVIVGNTTSARESEFLGQLAVRHGVIIEFRVNITDDELVQLYNSARALVYAPILEPFGFAPLEAMACGTPVVAVKEGGVRESVLDNETGLLTPRDPMVFAESLSRVLSQPAWAEQLGSHGRTNVERFWSWPLAYERLIAQLPPGVNPRA